MIRFNVEQSVYNISGVEVGGQPGERPMLLIGSMFFNGHKIIKDSIKGTFDRDMAKMLLDLEAEAASFTGNPGFIDVIGETGGALINYIEFVALHSKSPILVDSFSQKVRMEAIKHFAKTEVMPRLVYNSIAEDYTDEELACLKDCGVKSAVILAFSTSTPKPKSRIKLLQEKLLPAAEKAGIENMLIDPGVLDVPSVGWTVLAIGEIKETLGLPSGCAPSNSLYTWKKLQEQGQGAFEAAAASVFALTRTQGADFVFYGPIRNAPWVFTAAAAVDAIIAYTGRFTGLNPVTDDHPLYKIF